MPELTRLANAMYRNKAIRKASSKSSTVTPSLAKAIRSYARRHRRAHLADVATRFNVNPGRVSECLNYRR